MFAGVYCSSCLNPVTPQSAKRWLGHRSALMLTLGDGTLFILLSLLLLYISIFFPFSAAFLCSLHICQAFIKQLKEGVSFPWSTCQLFPISPAPWKGLQTPLFLGLGLGLGYKPYVRGWGSLWRDSLALQTGPGFSLRIDQPVWATQQHPKEPFGIVLHIKPVSSP